MIETICSLCHHDLIGCGDTIFLAVTIRFKALSVLTGRI